VVPVDQLGVPSYDELLLVAQRSQVDDDPDAIRLFLTALANGTRDAVANPAAATESILNAGKGLDPRLTRAEMDATLPLLAATPGQSFGQMDGARWELFAGWMADHGLISDVPKANEVLTNELLPPPPAQ
jgi:putative hydroxymethylpyrimidine transport system substrate-binding protein